MTLSTRIGVALVLGVAVAAVGRLAHLPAVIHACLLFEPMGTVFIRLIGMVVVPLVIGSLFVSVASLEGAGRLGRIGGRTLAYFFVTTALAALIGAMVALLMRVGSGASAAMGSSAGPASAVAPTGTDWVAWLVALVPSNPFAAAAQGDMLPLIVAVCLFGAAAAVIRSRARDVLISALTGVNELSMVVIGWIMALSPIAVFVLMAAAVARSGFDLLSRLALFVAAVVLALAVHVIVVLLPLVTILGRLGIRTFLTGTSEAVVLAGSTASSAATLPVSMVNALRLGISPDAVNFVLPAGSSVNKNGAAAYKAVTAVFLAGLYGVHLGPAEVITIVCASTMAAFAGAGVPGSSLVTTMIVLNAIGLGPQASAGIALVAGVDRPLDMCRSAVNTLGNLVGAAVVGRS